MLLHSEFEFPEELNNINRDELDRLVKQEEIVLKKRVQREENDECEEGPELTDLDWSCPWRFPLGSIVWCKMKGFPFWPAEVCAPIVNDMDIARERLAGTVWVRFFGWSNAAYAYSLPEVTRSWSRV